MHVLRAAVSALGFAVLLACASCTTYRDQLGRSQHAFEQNEHDRALAILRDLEPDMQRLSMPEQAQYAYLRGMVDYRVGYKPDARHWLSVAKAYEDNSPGVLQADWKARVNESLGEMNGVVYASGPSGLVTARVEPTANDDATAHAAEPDKRERRGGHGPQDRRDPKKEREPSKEATKDGAPPPAAKAADPASKPAEPAAK